MIKNIFLYIELNLSKMIVSIYGKFFKYKVKFNFSVREVGGGYYYNYLIYYIIILIIFGEKKLYCFLFVFVCF